jgi:hypothetical protein
LLCDSNHPRGIDKKKKKKGIVSQISIVFLSLPLLRNLYFQKLHWTEY